MGNVSDHYRLISREEAVKINIDLADAWKDPSIPLRQWLGVVREEIQAFRYGKRFKHFDTLLEILPIYVGSTPSLLDIGAASGFYSEVLRIGGFECNYTGLDYSEEFGRLAKKLFPDIDFKIADACALPFPDGSFDIAVSGCCLIHIVDYETAIKEAGRVSKNYVVLNRTPVVMDGPTRFFEKEAYGVRCVEIHFAQEELEEIFEKCRLSVVDQKDIFMDVGNQYGHTTILLRKF